MKDNPVSYMLVQNNIILKEAARKADLFQNIKSCDLKVYFSDDRYHKILVMKTFLGREIKMGTYPRNFSYKEMVEKQAERIAKKMGYRLITARED